MESSFVDRIKFYEQVLEQRVETLERELDSAISAAAHARTEKRQAESAQKAAEVRALEITKELENTSSMFPCNICYYIMQVPQFFSDQHRVTAPILSMRIHSLITFIQDYVCVCVQSMASTFRNLTGEKK